jgi:hypothetical protein
MVKKKKWQQPTTHLKDMEVKRIQNSIFKSPLPHVNGV